MQHTKISAQSKFEVPRKHLFELYPIPYCLPPFKNPVLKFLWFVQICAADYESQLQIKHRILQEKISAPQWPVSQVVHKKALYILRKLAKIPCVW